MNTHRAAKARASAVSESPSLLSARIESPPPLCAGVGLKGRCCAATATRYHRLSCAAPKRRPGRVLTHEGAAGCEDDELRELLVEVHHPLVAPLGKELLHRE